MNQNTNLELHNILQHYDLGDLLDFQKDLRGFVNTSFTIETIKDGKINKSFLRRYKSSIREEELLFEHSVVNHLVEFHSLPVACIYKTRQGKSYIHLYQSDADQNGVFYAIFDFLQGEDRYTWVDPECNDDEVISSAQTLAKFHDAVSDLIPQGKRSEPKIFELLTQIKNFLYECPRQNKHTIFDNYLLENIPLLVDNVEKTLAILSQPEIDQMMQCIIHCDFHPGNLKFSGGEVSGLFDFDWSKIDFRLFDVALALWYFFASWKSHNDGALRLKPLILFYETYQNWLTQCHSIPPLTAIERRYLPWMINASNIYVMNWTLLDYYSKDVDPQEYLRFLRHSVNFTRWFENTNQADQLSRIFE